MPPKPRPSAKSATKSKKVVAKTRDSEKSPTSTTETASGLPQEAEDQFEVELCWCIQQLQMTLATGKLHERQVYELGKTLNTLRSNTAPLVKKRQIMRNALGNYREKMAQEEQKLSRTVASVKFTDPPTTNKKYVFLRKAIKHSEQVVTDPEQKEDSKSQGSTQDHTAAVTEKDNKQGTFLFNFQKVD